MTRMVRPDQQFEVGDRGISYGPGRDDEPGEWCLRLATDDGRIDLLLDEDAMYDLWVEVQNVPWPRDGSEKEDLRREVVEHTGRMDAEQLREVLGIIKAIQHGSGWSR